MSAPHGSPQRVRLFANERLERLTLISPRTFILAWAILLPFIAWTGWGAVSALEGLGLVFAGLLVWTVFEYALHRFVFHLEAKTPVLKWLVFVIHGNHHDSPNDPLRGIMPLPASLPIAGAVWAAFALLLGRTGTWLFLGFMIGYVIYDLVHFACHQWPMRGKVGAALKRHHLRHHYANTDGNYAISAVFLDVLFRSKIRSSRR
ncbi:sterol desaturase family protein [Novosphingobium sp. M1R2S20]|uniref:Sterol desaturase family protein n=1 Tax=Novosphingobium rhizovicinum TaxID=3228928 RepID=A0ABV3RBB7_9SPHN